MKKHVNFFSIGLFILTSIFIAASLQTARTMLPNVDEAWFTLPGFNLAEHGFFGTTILDETSSFRQVKFDGINSYTYWIMPVFPLIQAGWGKLVGFGLIETRAISIMFGVIALVSWTILIKILARNDAVALTTAALMALDYHFVYAGSLGRMDMATVSLGVTGLAVYAWLREKDLNYAVAAGFTLTSLAFFTHPLGLMWAVSLAILIALLDLKQVRLRHFAFAAAPYIVLGLGWLVYISQRPDLFAIQFGGNASDRWGFFRSPVAEFLREVQLRYLVNFGIGEGLSEFGRIKIMILTSCVLAILCVLVLRPLRNQVVSRFLLIMVAQQFLMLLILDGMKQPYYMIYITPTLTAILAIWLHWLWTKNNSLKIVATAVFSFVLLINAAICIQRVRKDPLHANFLQAGSLLNERARAGDTVMASAEFWFTLDKKIDLVDDYRLGFVSGRKADFIVIDAPRYRDWHTRLALYDPATDEYIKHLIASEYEVIYDDPVYQIYKRSSLPL